MRYINLRLTYLQTDKQVDSIDALSRSRSLAVASGGLISKQEYSQGAKSSRDAAKKVAISR